MSEAAFLSAIPNNPTIYDPRTNKENTIKRRNKILKDMYEQKLIRKDQYEEAINEEIKVKNAQKSKTEKKNYVETYVIHCATKEIMKQKGFEFKYDFSSTSEKEKYQEEYDKMYAECKRTLYSAGYHIYTSIDPDVQKQLQSSVDNALSGYTEKDKNGIYKTQASGTCIDNDTGKVVAIVGGREQKNIGYTLNRAFQSPRQPGSAIKPLLVYAPALEHGWSVGSTVNDSPMSTKDKNRVRNSHGSYSGQISLRRAVQKSSNVATMRIYEQLTPKTCLKYLEEMNFKYLTDSDYKYYTTCIGGFTKGTTSEEMAAGYATLKNDGVYREPTCISKITTSDGDEVMSSSTKKRRVYSTNAANAMTDVLKSVVTGGTGVGAKVPNVDTAGKTGTTSLNKDGWFCGYTPYYTTAVWVGRDDNRIMESLSGASYPKSIWSNFMNAIHSEYSSTDSMGGNYTDYQGETTQQTGTQATTATESSTKGTEATTAAPTTAAPTTAAPTTAAPTTAAQQTEEQPAENQ